VKVVIFEKTGGPEVLTLVERPEPRPAEGEVLIDVHATALNFADLLQRRGTYGLISEDAEIVLGLEVSGTVAALGADVQHWKVGDKVCALLAGGGYAERVVVPAAQVLPCPEGLDLLQAAALPEAVCTVWSNVYDIGRLKSGESFLVHGGAGGVGSIAIQLARQWGAQVFTTAGSSTKRQRCEELGATRVIDYKNEDFTEVIREVTNGRGVDVILDNMGAEYLDRNIEALASDGRLVIIGLQSGREAPIHLGKMMGKRASLNTTSLRDRSLSAKQAIIAGVLRDVWPHIDAGRVVPVVDKVFDFKQIVEAHKHMESGDHIGKIVVRMPGR
jgi:putative PIG3 family NAD(P)H quinone oxidoreductase